MAQRVQHYPIPSIGTGAERTFTVLSTAAAGWRGVIRRRAGTPHLLAVIDPAAAVGTTYTFHAIPVDVDDPTLNLVAMTYLGTVKHGTQWYSVFLQ